MVKHADDEGRERHGDGRLVIGHADHFRRHRFLLRSKARGNAQPQR